MNSLWRNSAAFLRSFVIIGTILAVGPAWPATVVPENLVWPRPTIVPVPELTAGVAQTVSVLHAWKTISNPQGEFWSDSADLSAWHDLTTGACRGGGGFGGGGADKSAYRTALDIPADYAASSATSASNDFRAMKEHIYSAVALMAGTDLGLQAISDAHDAVRMDTTNIANGGGISIIVNNEWNYPQLGNSNYMKPPIKVGEGYSNTVRVRFARNSVAIEPPSLQK